LVPQDSNPRKIALARSSSNYKLQTCPLVREYTPKENMKHDCQKKISMREKGKFGFGHQMVA
jgi:hypothetical protein